MFARFLVAPLTLVGLTLVGASAEQEPRGCADEDGGLMQSVHGLVPAHLQDGGVQPVDSLGDKVQEGDDEPSFTQEVAGFQHDVTDFDEGGVADIVSRLLPTDDAFHPAPVIQSLENPCATVEGEFSNSDTHEMPLVSDECTRAGWGYNFQRDPWCNTSSSFPRFCVFPLHQVPMPSLHEDVQVAQPNLLELLSKVNRTYELERVTAKMRRQGLRGKAKAGKHDAQYIWAANAMSKALMAGDVCRPSTAGKYPAKPVKCDFRWSFPWWYNCHCPKGWREFLGLCQEDCAPRLGRTGHTYDSGSYCHVPCDRQHQVALNHMCPLGEATLCVENFGACVSSIASKVWALADVGVFLLTASGGSAVVGASKTARRAGKFFDGVRAMKTALKSDADEIVKRTLKNSKVRQQFETSMQKLAPGLRDSILENGAYLLLTNSLPASSDEHAWLWTVTETVDPSGVVSAVKEFVGKPHCDHVALWHEMSHFPDESEGDALGVLDARRFEETDTSKEFVQNELAMPWSTYEGQCRGFDQLRTCWYSTYATEVEINEARTTLNALIAKALESAAKELESAPRTTAAYLNRRAVEKALDGRTFDDFWSGIQPFTEISSDWEQARIDCRLLAEFNSQGDDSANIVGFMYFEYYGFHYCALMLYDAGSSGVHGARGHDSRANMLPVASCPTRKWQYTPDRWHSKTGHEVKLDVDKMESSVVYETKSIVRGGYHPVTQGPAVVKNYGSPFLLLKPPANPSLPNHKFHHQCALLDKDAWPRSNPQRPWPVSQ